MPIEVGIWRLGAKLERIKFASIDAEKRLEDFLDQDLSIVAPGLMKLGRQVLTGYGNRIDILAMDAAGTLHVIELKRNRTPREVVAQLLDYASWVERLSRDQISEIYSGNHGGKELEVGFAETFEESLPEDLNETHRLVVVAAELDPSTERIINYLSRNFGVPVNAIFFRYFRDGGNEYITHSWLVDPREAEEKVPTKKSRETWNGRDFYVSLGEGPSRNWNDCRKYGFVCGGGGKWYSQTLGALFPGARVFVNIPRTGFVGVGDVLAESVPVKDFKVQVDGEEKPILDMPLEAPNMGQHADDRETSEYLVRVRWIEARPREEAFWEKGLFAVQHTACRLRSRFTIERLTQHFELDD